MKHLKRFNESSIDSVYEHSHEVSNESSIVNILNDCKDILIDLSDNHIPYKVWVASSGSIIVDIGDDKGLTSLKNEGSTFDHLFSYLESFGYLMNGKKSFYEGNNWEYYESCPKCGSDEVTVDVEASVTKLLLTSRAITQTSSDAPARAREIAKAEADTTSAS